MIFYIDLFTTKKFIAAGARVVCLLERAVLKRAFEVLIDK